MSCHSFGVGQRAERRLAHVERGIAESPQQVRDDQRGRARIVVADVAERRQRGRAHFGVGVVRQTGNGLDVVGGADTAEHAQGVELHRAVVGEQSREQPLLDEQRPRRRGR